MGARGEVPCQGFGDEITNVPPCAKRQYTRTAAKPKATIAVPTQQQKDLCKFKQRSFYYADDGILHIVVIYLIH